MTERLTDLAATIDAAWEARDTLGLTTTGAVRDAVEEALIERFDRRPLRREGKGEGRWVLLDFGDAVIHVLHDEDRAFYALERLWGDSPAIDVQLPQAPAGATPGAGDDAATRAG